MKGLIYKDLIINRVSLIFYSVGIILTSISFLIIEGSIKNIEIAYTSMSVMLYGMLFICSVSLHDGCFWADNKRIWSAFSISTPVLVKGCVLEKYIYIMIISFSSLLYSFLFETVCVAAGITDSLKFYKLNIILFFISMVLGAVNIPFVVRLGRKYGSYVKTAALLLICAIFGVWFLFGDISVLNSPEKILTWISDAVTGNGPEFTGLIIILAVCSAFMLLVSYFISCGLYRNGIENCEK